MDEEANPRWRSSLPDGKPAHFFKIILPTAILDKKLRVPKAFVNQHGDDFSPIITLHDPNAREWKIGLEKSEDDDVWFSEGWDKFLEYYSITNEHFLVFRYEGDSRFHVLIFDMTGSEIQYPSQNLSPERNQVASSESSKSNHHDYHRSQNDNDNHNDIDNDSDSNNDNDIGIDHHFTEEYFPDDEDDSTHAYEEDDPYYSTSSSKSTSTSPSESTSPTKRRGFTKFIDKSSKRERRKEYSSPSSRSAFRRKRKRHQRGASERGDEQSDGGSNHKRRRSKEGRHRGRAKKADHVEYVGKQTVKSKSYEKRHISDRVRTKVIQAADNYRSRFPYFRAVLRPHNLYNSFMYVPARFAVKYLGGGSSDKKIRLENGRGKQWEARCFPRNGAGNGMNIGEGWAKFKEDNQIKEGDVCVFELLHSINFVLRVQIFRVRHYADR